MAAAISLRAVNLSGTRKNPFVNHKLNATPYEIEEANRKFGVKADGPFCPVNLATQRPAVAVVCPCCGKVLHAFFYTREMLEIAQGVELREEWDSDYLGEVYREVYAMWKTRSPDMKRFRLRCAGFKEGSENLLQIYAAIFAISSRYRKEKLCSPECKKLHEFSHLTGRFRPKAKVAKKVPKQYGAGAEPSGWKKAGLAASLLDFNARNVQAGGEIIE